MLGEEGARREIDAEKWTAGGGGGAAYAQRNYLPRQRSEAAGERARRRTAWSENRYVISEEEKEPSE